VHACASQLVPLGLQSLALCGAIDNATIKLFKRSAQRIGHAGLSQDGVN
jgi:hypothetical protein